MGFWKWPALLLVLFCLAIVYPYAKRSAGQNGLDETAHEARLHGCLLRYDVQLAADVLTVRARIAPGCATRLARPDVSLRGRDGGVLAQSELRGNPNSLFARLARPDETALDTLRLAFSADDLAGVRATVDARAALRDVPHEAEPG